MPCRVTDCAGLPESEDFSMTLSVLTGGLRGKRGHLGKLGQVLSHYGFRTPRQAGIFPT